MKTAEEIKAWLESREWYGEYKAAVEADDENQEFSLCDKYLSGEKGEDTIRGAFFWFDTPQGDIVWDKRDDEFLEWYNN